MTATTPLSRAVVQTRIESDVDIVEYGVIISETSQADPTHFPTSTAEQLYRCRSCERRRLEALTISAAGLRNYRSKGCSAAARPNLPRKKNI
jgi:hypothetical protein